MIISNKNINLSNYVSAYFCINQRNFYKLGQGLPKVTPVEMEVTKSMKQESRDFSRERFNFLLSVLLSYSEFLESLFFESENGAKIFAPSNNLLNPKNIPFPSCLRPQVCKDFPRIHDCNQFFQAMFYLEKMGIRFFCNLPALSLYSFCQ